MKSVAQPSAGITTALIYTRVSSDEQAREGVSLDAQLRECRQYAARQGWVIGTEYQDVMAGTRDDRPHYQRLLSDVRQNSLTSRSVVVVVAALDRLGRRLVERVRAREELKGLGVSVHSVREGGEVSDLVSNILTSVAQEEVRRLGERVRASHRHVTASGWRKVGWVAWGYRWREATPEERRTGAPARVLEPHDLEAPYVREAFERAASGQTIHAIAIWVAGLPDAVRGGRRLSYSAVRRTLMAAVYITRPEGATVAEPPGRWPALVDDATWQRVQEQIASHTRIPRQATGRYLLTGLLRCQRCGSRMTGATSKRIPSRYRCRASDRGAAAPDPSCTQAATAHKLDAAVLAQVTSVVETVASSDASFHARLRRAWHVAREPSVSEVSTGKMIQNLAVVATKARERLKRAALLLVDGDIDKQGYEMLRDQAQADLDGAETELARLRSSPSVGTETLPSLEDVLREAGGWATALRGGDTIAQREVLALLATRIEPVRIGHGKFDAVISWTPLGESLRAESVAFTSDAA